MRRQSGVASRTGREGTEFQRRVLSSQALLPAGRSDVSATSGIDRLRRKVTGSHCRWSE